MRSRRILAIVAVSLFSVCMVPTASAAVTYLRPNVDQPSLKEPWLVVGAPTAWASLDDNLTESEAPAASEYISAPHDGMDRIVGLETMAIAGASAITMQAWFYSETANSVILEVLRTPTSGTVASGTFATAGWHSLPLPAITQSELDNLVLRFRTTTGHSHIVQASFVKVSYTPSPAKVYWGADMDGEVANLERDSLGNPLPVRLDAPWTQETWDLFEQHAGKPVSIVHFGQPAPWNQSFAASPLELTSARGAIPMISMGSIGATLSELEEGGVKESALAKWAQEVAKYQKPFFLRWDWEMNLPSSTSLLWVNEAHSNPAAFVRAWRNFHRIAEREGASNITWVWCPNVSFLGSTSLKSLYPGNSYVDWTCMDGYNFGTMPGGSGWKSFSNVFSSTYAELTSSDFDGRAKPIMVGETASTEQGGSKPDWIAQALGTSMPDSFPKIKALVWFNWNITENGFEHDWPIESPVTTPSGPSPSAAAFANAISSPYYAGNTFGSLAPLTRIQPLP